MRPRGPGLEGSGKVMCLDVRLVGDRLVMVGLRSL